MIFIWVVSSLAGFRLVGFESLRFEATGMKARNISLFSIVTFEFLLSFVSLFSAFSCFYLFHLRAFSSLCSLSVWPLMSVEFSSSTWNWQIFYYFLLLLVLSCRDMFCFVLFCFLLIAFCLVAWIWWFLIMLCIDLHFLVSFYPSTTYWLILLVFGFFTLNCSFTIRNSHVGIRLRCQRTHELLKNLHS